MNNQTREISVLIGGKAGFGIDKASSLIASLLSQLGARLYIYRDYPSLIRGGHTFSIIMASKEKILAHQNKIDFLLALNQDTLDFHKGKLKSNGKIIYDSDSVKSQSQAGSISIGKIIQEEHASEVMRNSCIIGSFCKAAGIEWNILDEVFKKNIGRELDLNLKVARRGFDAAQELEKIEPFSQNKLPFVTGNEALALGLISAGLKGYIGYPMTPSSSILHFMANQAGNFGLKVIHPESEIGVILMALGFAYQGQRVAVGTSGGGFCLMTEGLSLAAMAELPIVIIVGQRPGPSTGLPTYTAQTELNFVLSAGQGEFSRFIVAPGDAEEAYYWSGAALNLAWKYQIPSIILWDKTSAEGTYSFDINCLDKVKPEPFFAWDKKGPYKRYLINETGVSPLAFPPERGCVIKINSYEHDESGLTTEDPKITNLMQEKRLRKQTYLSDELKHYPCVGVYADEGSPKAILCWGSNKGVCLEAGKNLGFKVIHLGVIWPFPQERLRQALSGVENLISVENNATGQLANLAGRFGIKVDKKVLRYDGRPFSVEELEENLRSIQ